MAVYFIQAGESGPVKIGTATCAWSRLDALQIANHAWLRMLGVMRGWHNEESAIQLRFAAYWIRGEWFEPHPDILVLAAAHYVEPPPKHVPARRRLAEPPNDPPADRADRLPSLRAVIPLPDDANGRGAGISSTPPGPRPRIAGVCAPARPSVLRAVVNHARQHGDDRCNLPPKPISQKLTQESRENP